MMPRRYPSNPIEYLVERRRNELPVVLPSQEQQACGAYGAELLSLSGDDLELRVCEELEKEARAQEVREKAYFTYWGRLPLWTLDEAVALTFGRNPELVTWSSLEGLLQVYPLAVQFNRLRRRVMRAKDAHQLSDPVAPKEYIAWACTNGVVVPRRLREIVDASQGQATDWRALYEAIQLELGAVTREIERLKAADKPLGRNERNTLLKLILGLAIKGYRYDHRAARSPNAKEIADDLADLGLRIDDDTVRKRLKEAGDEHGHLLTPPDAN
jgi:hypothetical protein